MTTLILLGVVAVLAVLWGLCRDQRTDLKLAESSNRRAADRAAYWHDRHFDVQAALDASDNRVQELTAKLNAATKRKPKTKAKRR
jgi:hypothetical protein